ncbi:MAG: lysophospholipase [Rhodospirillaceae bacterium]
MIRQVRRPDFTPRAVALLAVVLMLVACASPRIQAPGPVIQAADFYLDWFITTDGLRQPYKKWAPAEAKPRAVIVALHGFNDYSNFFKVPGAWFADKGLISYAYDQRGFGDGPDRGLWAGNGAYARDLSDFVDLVRRTHPGLPVYVLGESFGGAVAMVAASGPRGPDVDGYILAAPAVWGRASMAWYERSALWLMAHTVPWMRLSGQGLNITPSDNIEMLRELGRDWRVIKRTRVGTIHGLVGMMDEASASAGRFKARALVLYGARDDIIPGDPTFDMVRRLPAINTPAQTFALYDGGYHMLLRDLKAEVVWQDILAWIDGAGGALPSGADAAGAKKMAGRGMPATGR